MRQQGVNHDLVALHHIENAVGQPGLLQQIGHEQRCRRITLARLQNERVARCNGHRKHPARHHAREVERRDAGDDAQRLARGPVVDTRRNLLGVVALQQLRDAAGKLDDVDTARHFPLRIRKHLAVFGRDDGCELVAVFVHQFEETQHDPRAADRRRIAPLRECRLRARHCSFHVRRIAQKQRARSRAGSRIEDGLSASAGARDALAVNEMSDVCVVVEGLHCGFLVVDGR